MRSPIDLVSYNWLHGMSKDRRRKIVATHVTMKTDIITSYTKVVTDIKLTLNS